MQADVRDRILAATGAIRITGVEEIQPLWNHYGTLSRVHLAGGPMGSAILKHIRIPEDAAHPRGFGGAVGRARKVRSYEVETHWYGHQNRDVPPAAATPRCLDAFAEGGELFLLLEDLATRGFTASPRAVSWDGIGVGLTWLARFHATFLGHSGEGLWPEGTYWHLQTRPDELARIDGTRLHRFASLLDARLRCGGWPTLVHGDAKLANFLYAADGASAAAVDFQYVGRGCAMKDVAYFVGSCLSGADCERHESALLDRYFQALRPALGPEVDADALEAEWRALYAVAWADFERFMAGWSPGHRKRTDYSDATTERAIAGIVDELLGAAREACVAAATYIESQRDRPLKVASKGFDSPATDMVTEVDHRAQALILDRLAPTLARYDLGVLAEEDASDGSRLDRHAFWAIDPLDGTQFFVEGRPGYAVSVALVSREGKPILAVVVDPVSGDCTEAVFGGGVTRNGQPLRTVSPDTRSEGPPVWFADRSLRRHPHFQRYAEHIDLRFIGGAVVNVLQLLTEPHSAYVKAPKAARGGCAIWDLAAVSLFLSEAGGTVQTYDGSPLHLNRPDGLFFNDVGLFFASPDVSPGALRSRIRALEAEPS